MNSIRARYPEYLFTVQLRVKLMGFASYLTKLFKTACIVSYENYIAWL